jgi:hypothetical protein
MRLHAHSGFRGKVVDLDSGKEIPKVIWVDTESGELEFYQTNGNGEIKKDINGDYLTFRAKARIRLIAREGRGGPVVQNRTKIILGAPYCARCKSSLTLPGGDLCAFCNALDKGVHGFIAERITNPLADFPCEERYCGRLAEWQVADEVAVTPQIENKIAFERGAMVYRRRYCASHYKPPRLVDAKGEIIQELEDEARPR